MQPLRRFVLTLTEEAGFGAGATWFDYAATTNLKITNSIAAYLAKNATMGHPQWE